MESSANSYSPSPSNASTPNRKARTPFLTPCRRMGLARKSPASSAWHANKPSPGAVSPYTSSLKVDKDADTMHNDLERLQGQMTPTRNTRLFNRHQLTKRLKTNLSSPQSCDEKKKENSVVSSDLQSDDQITKSQIIMAENSKVENDGNEILLPAGDITEDTLKEVRKRLKEKEEKLKDLKLAQLYKRKHDVIILQKLIHTWLEGCQTALQELQTVLLNQGHQFTIEQLLNQLNIPHELVKYRRDTEDFESNEMNII
ncbi:Uncharacterized protein GBIM_02227 [Gryllus bimaculatus]|nr:Uncharacterized protein GBIM_02227 [Gryllus bimaculatus]